MLPYFELRRGVEALLCIEPSKALQRCAVLPTRGHFRAQDLKSEKVLKDIFKGFLSLIKALIRDSYPFLETF